PSGRSLCATSLACPNGPDRGRSSATRRTTIPSPHYHQQHRPDPSIRRARKAVEPAGTSENEIASRDPSERHTRQSYQTRHDGPLHHAAECFERRITTSSTDPTHRPDEPVRP